MPFSNSVKTTKMTELIPSVDTRPSEIAEFGEMTKMTELRPSVDTRLSEFAIFGEMTEMTKLIPSVGSRALEIGELCEMAEKTKLIPSRDINTHTRKSAQKKKKVGHKVGHSKFPKNQVSKKKKSRPNVGNSKNIQHSNCKQAKARRYVVFYKEEGYMSLVGPSKLLFMKKKSRPFVGPIQKK